MSSELERHGGALEQPAAEPTPRPAPEGTRAPRVTDEQAIHALTWARNFGDVASWERLSRRGAKWLVRLAFDGEISMDLHGRVADLRAFNVILGPREIDVVPHELALSNRDVLLFCYALAVGGWRRRPRSVYRDAWNRGEDAGD